MTDNSRRITIDPEPRVGGTMRHAPLFCAALLCLCGLLLATGCGNAEGQTIRDERAPQTGEAAAESTESAQDPSSSPAARWLQETEDLGWVADALFLPSGAGWVVGETAPPQAILLVYTPDGGETWQRMPVHFASMPRALHFVDSNSGWIVGEYIGRETTHMLIHTSDGGRTWAQQNAGSLPDGSRLVDVQFSTGGTGWVVGYGGTTDMDIEGFLLRTTNGGESWSSYVLGEGVLPGELQFVNDQVGWLGGWDAIGNRPVLCFTHDSGRTWSETTQLPGLFIDGMAFVDSATGWVLVDSQCVMKTDDGGATWREQYRSSLPNLHGLESLDVAHGWIPSSEGVLYTTDGGITWSAMPAPWNQPVATIRIVGADTIIGFGDPTTGQPEPRKNFFCRTSLDVD